MEQTVESFNIFLDSSRGAEGNDDSEADCYLLRLNDVNLDSTVGQFIRLTVTNFSMYKVFTNVNANNSRFTVRTNSGVSHLDLSHKNYATIREIGEDFATVLKTQLLADATGAASTANEVDISGLTPISSASIAGTTDNIISFDLVFKNTGTPVAHNLTTCLVQFYEKSPLGNQDSDIFDLLGGDRIRDNTITSTNSITTSLPNTNTVRVVCLYPAQRHTEQFVYLSTNIPGKNLATASLNAGNLTHDTNAVHHTTILGKFPIDTEVVYYTPSVEKEYFIDITSHHLTNIKLRLTDAHGRKIPQFGTGNQNKLGNLSFNAVLRVDVIQKFKPEDRPLAPPEKSNIPLHMTNPIVNPNGYRFYAGR